MPSHRGGHVGGAVVVVVHVVDAVIRGGSLCRATTHGNRQPVPSVRRCGHFDRLPGALAAAPG